MLATILVSCTLYYRGDGQPRKPFFSLKDKKGFVIPANLDTTNLYKYYGYYSTEGLTPANLENRWDIYEKFCERGRAYSFGTAKLEETNLNPEKASKGYYFYDTKKQILYYETYVNADGGTAITLKLKISNNGDTITDITEGKKGNVYIKEKIPTSWKRHKVNW